MNFNSIKVRLEHVMRDIRNILEQFQFHKGTIRTSEKAYTLKTDPDFNSIKVRLEQSYSIGTEEDFNFNSIKVRLEHFIGSSYIYEAPTFQFHKGTIRTLIERRQLEIKTHFNSIKVRLEPIYSQRKHYLSCDFNSIKVRLELLFGAPFKTFFLISIP